MTEVFAFYLFAGIVVLSGVMVILAKNPVHSVLWLILAFFNAAGLFVLLGAEFLAMILVIVYVGAVAVLFLFVVMMLDIDFASLRAGFARYLPFGLTIAALLFAELLLVLGASNFGPIVPSAAHAPVIAGSGMTNTQALGSLIYTRYVYIFQAAGMVLLTAMIGAIVLTHRSRPGTKRQNIGQQVARQAGRGDAQGARGQRRRCRAMIGLGHYLTVGAILFVLGVLGIFMNRKNVIVILMSIELILLSVNINFVAFSAFAHDLVGQVFAMFVLTVAAGEAAIGLAILVLYFRNRGTIAVDDINMMKG